MPSPIAHGSMVMLAQPALGAAWRDSTTTQRVLISLMALFVCGMPDLDIFIGLARTGDAFADHGYQTHSLLIAPIVGVGFALLAGAMAPRFRKRRVRFRAFCVGTALYALHVVMDYLTHDSRGVGLLWPIVQQRFASPVALFVGVEHSEWWLWREHVLTVTTELAFAGLVWFMARRMRRARGSLDDTRWGSR
ncbi:MAG: metal-dependent hydrolase [Phycisphaerales bacterium]